MFAGRIHAWFQWYLSKNGVGHCIINYFLPPLEKNMLGCMTSLLNS